MLRDTPVLISLRPALDEKVDLNDTKWEDIHVTTGALKMFFRELPEPLFTYGSFTDFVDAISESPLSFLILSTRWRHAPVHAAYVLLSAAALSLASECSDHKQRVNHIRDLIKKLPKPNHDTMQVLFRHLRR